MRTVLEYGEQIMVEGIENDVDSKFDPILEKQLIGGANSKKKKIKIGDSDYEFNERFKMYILCKLLNPHFTPELAAKTTIIDFCITPIGLEQQLQGVVISLEQKALEETLKQIFEEITTNRILLDQCQKDILYNLNQEGSLLDNENIVGVLNSSKEKSEDVKAKNIEAEDKKKDINYKREKYIPVATRGSVLYFSIVDMQEISKMYSTSLQQFIVLFKNAIQSSIPSNDIKLRVKNIMRKLTEIVYRYVVRGLFEKDKITFILIISFKILTSEKFDGNVLLKQSDIDRFIRAGSALGASEVKECPFEVLNNKSDKKTKEWLNLNALVNHKFNGTQQVFSKLMDKISDNYERFKTWYVSNDPENNIPFDDVFTPYSDKMQQFLKLVFIRSFREDRTNIYITQKFVPKLLDDEEFLKVIDENIKNIYQLSNCTTPILYLLSAGADPSADIRSLAEQLNKKVTPISMGQNMEKVAEMYVNDAVESGNWVLLENCHLGLKYMADLDTLLKSETVFNEDMRIWLSCSPDEKFPIGLLHQSLKVTNEPPKGLVAGITKTFSSVVTQTMLDEFEFREWKNLVFTLSFMHSLVIERRKYGPLGWCNPYDFNDSDLKASIEFVKKQFLKGLEANDKEKPSNMMNFITLKNVVSVILYGGRIFDDEDTELFSVIAETYLERKLFDKPNDFFFYPTEKDKASFVKGGPEYKLPNPPDGDMSTNMTIEKYKEYINVNFPPIDPPQVFGLHPLADLTFRLKEFNELLDTIQITLPKDGASAGGLEADEELKKRVVNLINNQPQDFIEDEFRARIKNMQYGGKSGLEVPLHNVLLQEIIAVQNINIIVKKSLVSLK
jgi:dynein heavy chain